MNRMRRHKTANSAPTQSLENAYPLMPSRAPTLRVLQVGTMYCHVAMYCHVRWGPCTVMWPLNAWLNPTRLGLGMIGGGEGGFAGARALEPLPAAVHGRVPH